MASSFCLRISHLVRARPVLTLESILISYSPIFFIFIFCPRWLILNIGLSSLCHFLRKGELTQWIDSVLLGITPELSSISTAESWIRGSLAVRPWASHSSSLGLRILLYQRDMVIPPPQSAVHANWDKCVYTWPRQFEAHHRNFKMLFSLLLYHVKRSPDSGEEDQTTHGAQRDWQRFLDPWF